MTVASRPPDAMSQPTRFPTGRQHRLSYWKTTGAAGVVASGAIVGLGATATVHLSTSGDGIWSGFVRVLVGAACLALGGWAALVVAGGLIALRRDDLESSGRPYAAENPREFHPGRARLWLRSRLRFRRSRRSLPLLPGERVQIRPLADILATLDDDGTLDGLPFMPEMVEYCGQEATVFRRVDKMNDWVHHDGLKRVHNTAQLEGARCSGAAHGGCQANCRLRWNEAWLRRVGPDDGEMTRSRARGSHTRVDGLSESDLVRLTRRQTPDPAVRYMCQATEIGRGNEALAWSDPRHFVRDLASGNVRLRPWITGIAIACFNWMQRWRDGVEFPYITPSNSRNSPSLTLGLQTGDLVRVKPKKQIEATLNDRGQNRGLRFDAEMLRFCGGTYHVAAVLQRVIVEGTGDIRDVVNPCIILDGVRATGEYRAFNPEDEHIFWREIWLERLESAGADR